MQQGAKNIDKMKNTENKLERIGSPITVSL